MNRKTGLQKIFDGEHFFELIDLGNGKSSSDKLIKIKGSFVINI